MSEIPGVRVGHRGSASETLRLAFVRIAGVCAYTDPCIMGIMLTGHSVPPAYDISRYKSSHVRCGALCCAVLCCAALCCWGMVAVL
jgi:hypothetical protein